MKELSIEELDKQIKFNLDEAEELKTVLRYKVIELQDYHSKRRGYYENVIMFYKQKCEIYKEQLTKDNNEKGS